MKKTVAAIFVFILSLVFFSCTLPDNSSLETWESVEGLLNPQDLSSFRADITDATALGIQNAVIGSTRFNTARFSDSKNYMVKTTVDYSEETSESDIAKLVEVTFVRISNEGSPSELTGTKRVVASGSKEYPHEGTIAFMATDGFTYNVYDSDGILLYEGIVDNDTNDLDPQYGIIRIGNLIKGSKYIVEYIGSGEEIIVSQDEINGEIDKLYVLGNYTFVSFVPKGTSSRPSENELQYDSDGIALYDKCNYYTDSTRVSLIINNDTGYIYVIENFHITNIQGGCLLSDKDDYIYDFKVNEQNELEIYPLFTNPDISWSDVFKDKYGHIYVRNNRVNILDEENNALFYMYDEYLNDKSAHIDYELNSNGEAVKIDYKPGNSFDRRRISDVSIINDDWSERELNRNDSFEIYYKTDSARPYMVKEGILYGYDTNPSYYWDSFLPFFYWFSFDSATRNSKSIHVYDVSGSTDQYAYGLYALENYDVLLLYNRSDRALYYLPNAWSFYSDSLSDPPGSAGWSDFEDAELKIALEDCDLADNKDSFLKFGLHGNTYYDVVIEEDNNGNIVVNSYISGTYEKPPLKIVLQPINR